MKHALIIGNNRYDDSKLAKLKTPAADAQALARILGDKAIGSFDEVTPLINHTESQVRRAISSFLTNKKPDDLVLVYFSGHGVLDDRGRLYLALKDTQFDLLKATSIPSSFLADEMDSCRSKRQILILDCCHSGAFARGTKGPGQKAITETTFEGSGFGRVVLTASDSTQYALEGDQVIKQTELSLFTHFLLQGLKTGEADMNSDGHISLDEWYDYTYAKVISETPRQVPHKWSYNQQGDLVIARNPFLKKKMAELPYELIQALESSFVGIRESAVNELGKYLNSRDPDMVDLAVSSLKKMKEDDSRRISLLAGKLLSEFEQEHTEVPVKAEAETVNVTTTPSISPTMTAEPDPALHAEAAYGRPDVERAALPVDRSSVPQPLGLSRSFWLQWIGTTLLGLFLCAVLYVYSLSNLSYLVHFQFALLAASTGFVQWSIFRRRLDSWWIAANAAIAALLGATHYLLYQTTDWSHDDFLKLLAVWVITNFVVGLLLIRSKEQRSRDSISALPAELTSSLIETGPRQNIVVMLLSLFLVFYGLFVLIGASRDSGFMSIADVPFYLFWNGTWATSILLGASIFFKKDVPRNLGFISLALFAVLGGVVSAMYLMNSSFPLHFFGVPGVMALLAAFAFAAQNRTWTHMRYILLVASLLLIGLVFLGLDDYLGGYTAAAISAIVSLVAGIFFFLRK